VGCWFCETANPAHGNSRRGWQQLRPIQKGERSMLKLGLQYARYAAALLNGLGFGTTLQ